MKKTSRQRKRARRAPAGGRRVSGKGARRPARRSRPILQESALARATAKAVASIKTTLAGEPAILAEDALKAAEQLGMLLDDQETEEDSESGEEDEYFLRMRRDTGTRPRSRPAPAIAAKTTPSRGGAAPASRDDVSGDDAVAPGEQTAARRAEEVGAGGGAPHLFPRNLKTGYPVAVRAEGIWIYDSAGKKYLDGCGGAVVCSIGHGVDEVAEVMTK